MRVLHVAEAFGGGLMEVVKTLSERSAEAGCAVGIAYGIRPETPADLRSEIADTVELFPMPWTRRTLSAQIGAVRELRGLIRRWRPNVVHLHSSFAGVVGSVAAGRGVATVYSPHAYASLVKNEGGARRAAFRVAERFASRRVSSVGAVSQSEARAARDHAGARRVEVVENGIPELDASRLLERPRPPLPRVVAMGRTVPQRRPDACARILEAVRDVADVRWIGGGGGERGVEGAQALEAAGVPSTGWLPRDEGLTQLGASTAYLHWTSWDGQPLSILEAMAQDVVVVASNIEPNREILGPLQVFEREDDAISALRRIVLDEEFGSTLLASQRERRRHYSAERMVRDWMDVYDKITGPCVHGREPHFHSHSSASR